jgi:hypothetical protein
MMNHQYLLSMILGFRRGANICYILGFCEVQIGRSLPMFRQNISVPSSRVKQGPVGCTEKATILRCLKPKRAQISALIKIRVFSLCSWQLKKKQYYCKRRKWEVVLLRVTAPYGSHRNGRCSLKSDPE